MVTKKKAKPKSKRTKPKAKKAVKKLKGKKAAVKKAGPKKSKSSKPKKVRIDGMSLEKIGEVTHYFPHVNAAAVKIMKDGLKLGDNIYIKGHTTDFKERVNSIQLDRIPMPEGRKGQEIGLFVKSRVRIGDAVYKII